MAKKPKTQRKTGPPPPAPVRKAPPRSQPSPAAATKPRDEKRMRAAQQARRQALRRRLIAAGLIVAAVAAVVGYVSYDRRQAAELDEALTSGTCRTDTESDPTRPPGQNHVENPSYAVNPPAGGDHLTASARSGVYSGESLPPEGMLVHSLEHGYIILWHQTDLPAEQLTELEQLEERFPGDIIVAERPSMPVPVAATAWNQRLLCDEVETDAMARFASEHIGKGPEDVPRG